MSNTNENPQIAFRIKISKLRSYDSIDIYESPMYSIYIMMIYRKKCEERIFLKFVLLKKTFDRYFTVNSCNRIIDLQRQYTWYIGRKKQIIYNMYK